MYSPANSLVASFLGSAGKPGTATFAAWGLSLLEPWSPPSLGFVGKLLSAENVARDLSKAALGKAPNCTSVKY